MLKLTLGTNYIALHRAIAIVRARFLAQGAANHPLAGALTARIANSGQVTGPVVSHS